MKYLIALLPLLCLACAKPPTMTLDRPTVTAILNDSVWAGRAQVIRADAFVDKPCAQGAVTLMIKSDFPYPDNGSYTKPKVVNGCLSDTCITTQRLTFHNVPRRKGTYSIATLNACGMFTEREQYNYSWHVNGSGLKRIFKPQPGRANWVRVTYYDSQAGIMAGRFKANLADYRYPIQLVDSTGRVARFRKGRFVVKLPK